MEDKEVDRNRDSWENRIGPDKGKRKQEVEPDQRIRNQVAVWADSKTSVLKSFLPRPGSFLTTTCPTSCPGGNQSRTFESPLMVLATPGNTDS